MAEPTALTMDNWLPLMAADMFGDLSGYISRVAFLSYPVHQLRVYGSLPQRDIFLYD